MKVKKGKFRIFHRFYDDYNKKYEFNTCKEFVEFWVKPSRKLLKMKFEKDFARLDNEANNYLKFHKV